MKSHTYNTPIKLFAWLLIPVMSILGAGQLPVICFEANGSQVIEVKCVPGINATSISLEESIFHADQSNRCFDCVDFRIGENTRVRISKPDLSLQLIATQSKNLSLIRLQGINPATFLKFATDSCPTRLALKTVVLLV